MQIKIEDFPAQHIINFYPSQPLTTEPFFTVVANGQKTNCLFLQNVMNINAVTRCLVTPLLVGIQYAENAKIDDLKALVLAEIDDYFSDNGKLFADCDDLPLLKQTEAVADSFIRPTLYRDKGGIDIEAIDDGVLYLRFTGHCAGCPYAQNTLNNVIVKTLKKYLPQISSVQIKE